MKMFLVGRFKINKRNSRHLTYTCEGGWVVSRIRRYNKSPVDREELLEFQPFKMYPKFYRFLHCLNPIWLSRPYRRQYKLTLDTLLNFDYPSTRRCTNSYHDCSSHCRVGLIVWNVFIFFQVLLETLLVTDERVLDP